MLQPPSCCRRTASRFFYKLRRRRVELTSRFEKNILVECLRCLSLIDPERFGHLGLKVRILAQRAIQVNSAAIRKLGSTLLQNVNESSLSSLQSSECSNARHQLEPAQVAASTEALARAREQQRADAGETAVFRLKKALEVYRNAVSTREAVHRSEELRSALRLVQMSMAETDCPETLLQKMEWTCAEVRSALEEPDCKPGHCPRTPRKLSPDRLRQSPYHESPPDYKVEDAPKVRRPDSPPQHADSSGRADRPQVKRGALLRAKKEEAKRIAETEEDNMERLRLLRHHSKLCSTDAFEGEGSKGSEDVQPVDFFTYVCELEGEEVSLLPRKESGDLKILQGKPAICNGVGKTRMNLIQCSEWADLQMQLELDETEERITKNAIVVATDISLEDF